MRSEIDGVPREGEREDGVCFFRAELSGVLFYLTRVDPTS